MMKSLFTAESIKLNITEFFESANTSLKTMSLDKMMMAFGMLNINNNKVQASIAGIPPLLLYKRKAKEVEEVKINGFPLGAMLQSNYKIYESELQSGDTLLMFSDGMPELQNEDGALFGYERISKLFSRIAEQNPEMIIKILKQECFEWLNGKNPDDDITFVVIKVK